MKNNWKLSGPTASIEVKTCKGITARDNAQNRPTKLLNKFLAIKNNTGTVRVPIIAVTILWTNKSLT